MDALLAALAASPPAAFLRGSFIAYPFVNAAHILGIGLLIGSIVTLDLRLLGAFRHVPVGAVAPLLSRVAATGLAVALLTGFLLFIVRPEAYAANPALQVKLALVGLGTLNALLLHRGAGWKGVVAGAPPTPALRLAAAASLSIWPTAVIAGRWIAFVE